MKKMTTLALMTLLPMSALADTSAFDSQMEPVLAQYLKIQSALAGDNIKGVKAAAKQIAAQAKKVDASGVSGEHAAHYKDLPGKIAGSAVSLAKAKDIKAARDSFKMLSMPMAMWGTMSKPAGIDVVFCSMAKASWLQKTGEVRNPYMGAKMPNCGEVVGGARHEANHGSHHDMNKMKGGDMQHGEMDHSKMGKKKMGKKMGHGKMRH